MGPRLPFPRDFLCDHSLLSLFLPGDTKRADGQEIYQLQGRVTRIFLFFFSLFSTMWATNIAMQAAKTGGVASLFMGQCHFIRGSDAFCKSAAEELVCLKQNYKPTGIEYCSNLKVGISANLIDGSVAGTDGYQTTKLQTTKKNCDPSLLKCFVAARHTCGPGYKKCLASDPSGDKTLGDSVDAAQVKLLQEGCRHCNGGFQGSRFSGCHPGNNVRLCDPEKVKAGDRYLPKIHQGCFCDADNGGLDNGGYGLADDCNCDLSKGKVYGCVDWTYSGDFSICSATGSDSKIGGTRLDITLNILAAIYGRLLDLAIGLTVFRYSIYRKSVTPELVDDEGLCPPLCAVCCKCLGPGAQRIIILIWVAISVPVVIFTGTLGLTGPMGVPLAQLAVSQFVFEWIIAEPAETAITCLLGMHDTKQLMNEGEEGGSTEVQTTSNPVDADDGADDEEKGKKKKGKKGKK